MKKQTARIESVKVESGLDIICTFTDNRKVRVNLSALTQRFEVFSPLEDAAEFATVTVADFGWSLEWGCGASLDADRVLELALEQSGLIANVTFRHWQDTNLLSLTQAAEAIGLSRRTVSQYRTGNRPVPRTVSLACRGWECEHGSHK
jgi:hypothetical protein